MRKVAKQAIVPFSVEQMYHLIDDIESYPKYLPWCESTEILSRSAEEVSATIRIAKGAVRQSFTTLNRLFPTHHIEVTLLEGPFRHLQGEWRFEDYEQTETQSHAQIHGIEEKQNPMQEQGSQKRRSQKGCIVYFNLEFDLSNRLLDMALGGVLEKVTGNFLAAFCEEAEKRYGRTRN